MNNEWFGTSPSPPRHNAVRWTLIDLILIAGLTVALVAVAFVLLRFTTTLGIADLRTFFATRPVLAVVASVAIVDLLAVLATALVIVARKRGSWRDIGFRAPPLLPMLLTPAIFIGQMTLMLLINLVIVALTGQFNNPQVATFTDPNGFSWTNLIFALIAGAVIAPIVEELVFRGLLYQWLRSRAGVAIAVIASAAIFGAIHMIPIAFPALFMVGIVLAVAFEYSRSLWVPITLHSMQNAVAISLLFFVQANPQLFDQPLPTP